MTYGLPFVLDNTPWWLQDSRTGTGQGLGRCNPYGYETGDMIVLGGTADPAREKHAWRCENWADGKYRMTCTAGHYGVMVLCYAHVYTIRKRMSGLCPRCAWPDEARQLQADIDGLMSAFQSEPRSRWAEITGRLEDRQRQMNELVARGIISSGAPLRLEEVS